MVEKVDNFILFFSHVLWAPLPTTWVNPNPWKTGGHPTRMSNNSMMGLIYEMIGSCSRMTTCDTSKAFSLIFSATLLKTKYADDFGLYPPTMISV